jgi:hypothetical protein
LSTAFKSLKAMLMPGLAPLSGCVTKGLVRPFGMIASHSPSGASGWTSVTVLRGLK